MMILRLVGLRLITAAITLLFVSAIVFAAVEVLPGDVATNVLGQFSSETAREALRQQLHLDEPPVDRYLLWLGGLLQGDLGIALSSRRPITEVLGPRVSNTLILSAAAILIYIPLALLPAMLQALHRNRPVDHAISTATLVLASIPDFLLALFLLILFVVALPLLPAVSAVTGLTDFIGWLRALVLPASTLAIVMAVYAARMLRDNLIEVLDAQHVLMARLRGLPEWRVVWIHALPNALLPTLNITALNLTYLAGGVVIVEKVFGFPGFGSLMIDAIRFRDVPLIEITVLLASAVYVAANLLADIAALLLNPKLRQVRA
ncbi:MAG: ABC transporter permease [Pseudomonadota bacterium]|nr:ABC transporter permease [Pseudomonadota bacterium]